MKKSIITFIVFVLLFSFCAPLSSLRANAMTMSEFEAKVETFKLKYPNGSTYIDNPTYTGGYQCFGFANEIARDIFGSYPTNSMSAATVNSGWTCTYGADAIDNLCAGDIVRFYFHSIFITAVDGETVYCCDANSDHINTVYYDKVKTKSNLRYAVSQPLTSGGTDKTGWVAHYTNGVKDANSLTMYYSANGGTLSETNLYTVNSSSGLMLRSGAGTANTSLCVIPNGTLLSVTETYNDGQYTWGKTVYSGSTGWCALDYTTHEEYYLNPQTIYKASDNTAFSSVWEYGSGSGDGLKNASEFGLTKDGCEFLGWSEKADGSSTVFRQDDISLKAEDICPTLSWSSRAMILYAIWSEPQILLGDVNGDGIVTTADARLLLLYSLGNTSSISSENLSAADVIGDGTINTADARTVLIMNLS